MTMRMVFADDSSPGADAAWLWINSHPWPGWQIEVLTAVSDAPHISETPEEWQPPVPRELLRPIAETPIVHKRVFCDPKKGLRACGNPDLLVLGPRGSGLLKALRLGSTSEALIHDPPAPMVIARHGRPTRRVVVCADGSDHSRTAKAALLQMPWAGEVDVLVVSVPETGFDAASVARRAAATLADGVRSVEIRVPKPSELDLFYHPREIILETLTQWSADLVVLGSRGLSRFEALKAGSIATSLAADAPCSVLLAPQSMPK